MGNEVAIREFSGKIIAEGGEIARWKIQPDMLCKLDSEDNPIVGLYAGEDHQYASLYQKDDNGQPKQVPIRFFVGNTTDNQYLFAVLEDGSTYLQKAQVGGEVQLFTEDGTTTKIQELLNNIQSGTDTLAEITQKIGGAEADGISLSQKLTNIYNLYSGLYAKIINTDDVPQPGDSDFNERDIYAGKEQFDV